MNTFDLYKDVNNLSHLTQVDKATKKDPYKYMNYNLAWETPYPYNHKGVYAYETKKQELHYPLTSFRPPNTYYDDKTSELLRYMNNRYVDVSGMLYNVNDIPLRTYTSTRQY